MFRGWSSRIAGSHTSVLNMTSSALNWPSLSLHLKTGGVCLLLYLVGFLGINIFLFLAGLLTYLAWSLLRRQQQLGEDEAGPSGEESPEWMNKHNLDRTDWINEVLVKIWPTATQRLEARVKAMLGVAGPVEAYLRKQGGGTVYLESFQLGAPAPELESVQIRGVSQSELILDAKLTYKTKPLVRFSLTFKKYPRQVHVCRFSLTGMVRISCTPLLEERPYVGGVKLSFLDLPEFDFDLDGGDVFLDNREVRHLVHTQLLASLEQCLMLPAGVEFIVPHSAGKGSTNLQVPRGIFCFRLVEAKDLNVAVDPHARISFSVDGKKHGYATGPTIGNAQHPTWNHQVVLLVDKPETFSDISVSFLDTSLGALDDFYGELVVYKDVLRQIFRKETKYDYWKILDGNKSGRARVSVSWTSLDITPPRHSDDQAVVMVYLEQTKHLFQTKIQLSIGNRSFSSDIIASQEVVSHILSNNPTNDDLQIELIDSKDYTVLGSVTVELTQLLNQEGLSLRGLELPLNVDRKPVTKLQLSCVLRYLRKELPLTHNNLPLLPVNNHLEVFSNERRTTAAGSIMGDDLSPDGRLSEAGDQIDAGSETASETLAVVCNNRPSLSHQLSGSFSEKNLTQKEDSSAMLPRRGGSKREALTERLDWCETEAENQVQSEKAGVSRTASEKDVRAELADLGQEAHSVKRSHTFPSQKVGTSLKMREKKHAIICYSDKSENFCLFMFIFLETFCQ